MSGGPGLVRRLGTGDAIAIAFSQSADRRPSPRALQVAGAAGCPVLVATLPWTAVVTGAAVFAVGAVYRAARLRLDR